MGHIRLGKIPKSRKWKAVVALISDGAGPLDEDVGLIAARVLDAAEEGLRRAKNDSGLQYAYYLLTQVALASRESGWQHKLAGLGITIDDDSTIADLTSEIQSAIDDRVFKHGRPSDVSEMALQAVGEALLSLATSRSITLFGSSGEALKSAVRELSTKSGFSRLGQAFFGRFMARFLNFSLSRVTAAEVGGDRLRTVEDLSRFNDALRTHCEQSAAIVSDFCGQWYSTTEFKRGIDTRNTGSFVAVAVQKLRDELAQHRKEQ